MSCVWENPLPMNINNKINIFDNLKWNTLIAAKPGPKLVDFMVCSQLHNTFLPLIRINQWQFVIKISYKVICFFSPPLKIPAPNKSAQF